MMSAHHRLHPHRSTIIVLAIMLAFSAGTTILVRSLVDSEHRRVLDQRAGEVASLFQVFGSATEQALATTGAFAASGAADERSFRRFVASQQGDTSFDAVAVLREGAAGPQTVATTTTLPRVLSQGTPAQIERVMAAGEQLRIIWPVGTGLTRTLGIARSVPAAPAGTVVYAEFGSVVPTATPDLGDQPEVEDQSLMERLEGLDIVLSIDTGSESSFLFGTTDTLAAGGVMIDVPFGEDSFTVGIAPNAPLLSTVVSSLPWIALTVSLILAIAITLLVEITLRRRDHALATVDVLRAKNEELDCMMTEQRRAEEQLIRAQRLDAIGQLAGGVAHDFNNLLAAILASARFAAEDLGAHPAREDVQEVIRAATRASELTKQLLVYSRREASEPRVVHLAAAVASMERMLRRTLGEQVTVVTELSGTARVSADPAQLEQVLMNLTINARDALHPGGSLVLSVTDADLDAATAGAAGLAPGPYAVLTVTDTGEGMDEATMARAFEPFFTTKARGSGTGMGLAITDAIARRWHGGTRLRSRPGAGTTVEVYLPATAEPASLVSVPTGSTPLGNGEMILLVEDEPGVRRTTRRMLERNGYRVLDAPDGVTALQRFADHIDLILTDVMMPGGVTGLDLLEQLRERRPEVRALFMSGYSADVATARGAAAGGIDLVEKPFTERELLTRVAAALRGTGRTIAS